MMTIRKAESEDDALKALSLIRLLAEYEHLEGPDESAAGRFVCDVLKRENAPFELYLAETENDEAVGYVLFFQTYSTFLCKPCIYVEDLFVEKPWRGKGFGKALLTYCIDLARQRGCGRVEWSVLDWNTPAQEFYQSLGALHMTAWQPYRLSL
jgi:GNAT superfamily N-acetyltransferase